MAERILLFFGVVGLGYLVRRGRLIGSEGVRDLIRVNMDVCLPALTFTTAASRLTPEVANLSAGLSGPLLGLPAAAILTILGGWLLGRLTAPLAGLHGTRATTYVYLITFANAAFLPIPLAFATHGELGILYVSLYTLAYTPLFWTWGTWMFTGRIRWGFFLHPNLVAIVLGAAVGMSRFALPAVLLDALRALGGSAVALGLLYAGAILAEHRLAPGADLKALVWLAGVKLVAVPAITLLVIRSAGIAEPIASQALLQAAMPAMAQAGIYTARFGGDAGLGSKASVLTTALCLLSVPFWMARLG